MLFGLYGSVARPDLHRPRQRLLFTAFAVTWTGARVFDHHKPLPICLFAGAALWLVVCRLPAVEMPGRSRAARSGIIATYTWAHRL